MATQNQNQNQNNADLFDAYFRRADLDGDGQISGAEAVAFFQGANLPKHVLAQVWMHADQKKVGYLGRQEFYNALKLVTVAQSKRELTPDMVKAALYGPASAKIPAPKINLATTPAPQSRVAASIPLSSGTPSVSPQNLVVRGTPGLGNASTNQQFLPSQQNQFMRPPQAVPPSPASPTQQITAANLMPRGGNIVAPHPPSSNVETNWLGGSVGGPSTGVSSQVANQGIVSSTNQGGFGMTVSGLTSSVQPRPPVATGQMALTASKPQDSLMPSNQHAAKDYQASVISANGFASDSLFGDVFSATPSQPTQTSLAVTSSTSSSAVSTASVPASGPQISAKPSPVESLQSKLTQQPVAGQYQQGHPTGKAQQVVAQSTAVSTGTGNLVSGQSTQAQLPWPKMMQSDVQKYTKVFLQVDTDRDGKITGEEARNLFLSWRLPREVLKKVWDLSDQDNDSMLSLREFCTALYLMERYREGHPLPTVLPSSMIIDETLFPTSGRPAVPYGGAAWGSGHGLQQPQVINAPRPPLPSARGRPPRPATVSQTDANLQLSPRKPKIPVLEKHLIDQLTQEEQDSLNSKLKEATEADKKVEELEREIQESKMKTEFYRVKMQELVLYKSRCDNRFNEITERVSADKLEVEALAKKYEEKYRQAGNVASRLTLEESTFRDIQERKMELYQAIVKFEAGDTADGDLQDHANHIQQGLEELVKNVNERCKQYGLRSKPMSLVELPFGWQPGIQEGAADWDEDWDKFEDEGFTFVKDLTLDVQNVIAPPKPKSSSVQKQRASTNETANLLSVDADEKSGKTNERITEDMENNQSENGLEKSSSDSPAENGAVENKSQEFQDSLSAQSSGDGLQHSVKTSGADVSPHAMKTSDANGSPHSVQFDGSPHATEIRSDQGSAESIFSGEKSFEPGWGRYDIHYDPDSLWGVDNDSSKKPDQQRHDSNSLFGLGDFNIKPIKIQSSNADFTLPGKSSFTFDESVPSTPAYTDNMFQGKSSSSFADSIPNTPAYADNLFKGKSTSVFVDSVPSTPAYADNLFKGKGSSIFADSVPSTPAYADNLFKGKGSSVFADSVPSTPGYSFGNSQRGFGEGSDEHSFDSFSRFDSFNMHESGFSQGSSLARFDSFSSTRDYDQGHGFPLSFDSFNAHDGRDGGASQSQHYLARFDSTRSTTDFDHSRDFPSFDDVDPFGSTGPFRTTLESQTPRKDTEHWSAF
ncbi:hypothetical protein SLEP1_g39052 [Rubroshorea leprosula]|uniref:Uncharacterized protein n=1 Tax=Rubroshorea leprosula TaxID=152421 RepID=A0AAV5KZE4_9ROSI|nr:hypothetical protein SLEP1_g39052 [Rubroshorea leprosula]